MDLNIEMILAQLSREQVCHVRPENRDPELRDGHKQHHHAHHPLHDPADQPQVPTIDGPPFPPMSWDHPETDVTLRKPSSWHPSFYAYPGSDVPVTWAAVEAGRAV
jgi:hypothetical protein